jgi:formylglycine-generating enzyme required for sulfatase activity
MPYFFGFFSPVRYKPILHTASLAQPRTYSCSYVLRPSSRENNMSNVFISYRREDAAGYAQAVFGQLERHLRREQIFMDVDTIEPGVDFVTRLEQAVGECEVLIALIGKRWKGERDNAPPRIYDAHDFVRLELEAALSRGIRVIPVLVDDASMPSTEELPQSLQPLVRRNALQLSNTRFRFDLERVSQAAQKALIPASVPGRAKWPSWSWMLYSGTSIVVIILGLLSWHWIKGTEQEQTVSNRVEQPAPPATETPLKEELPSKSASPLETQQSQRAGKVFRDRLKTIGEGPEMVPLPAGSFQMGDIEGRGSPWAKPAHVVRIRTPFAVGRYEVTFEDYDRFAKATGRRVPHDQRWGRGRRPIINISWQDGTDYSRWLSEQTGQRYRLLTEAEWEYAARAGTETAYWWGKDFLKGMANCNGCGSHWDDQHTAPVASFKPNRFGLYDTAGNVWEWVEDCWHESYKGAPTDGTAWLSGGDCSQRVTRGGSLGSKAERLSTYFRDRDEAQANRVDIGFRLARDIQ